MHSVIIFAASKFARRIWHAPRDNFFESFDLSRATEIRIFYGQDAISVVSVHLKWKLCWCFDLTVRKYLHSLLLKKKDMAEDPFEIPFGDDEDFDLDSPAAAMARLRDRLRAIHPQASTIITGYAALELEVDQVLREFVAKPTKLPRLSMEHQLGLLRAMLDDEWLGFALDAISAYGALRNSIAHGDDRETIEKKIRALGAKTYEIGIPLEDYKNLGVVAMHLASALHVGTEIFECRCAKPF